MTKKEALRLEYLPLDELLRWPGNPKTHATEAIEASVARFGFRDPLAIDENTGRLVAGHGRLTVLERLRDAGKPPPAFIEVKGDQWLVPVVRGGAFESEDDAAAYLVGHNRLSELGGWDDAALSELLAGLDSDLAPLTGFDLDAMLADLTPADPTDFLNDLIPPRAAKGEESPKPAPASAPAAGDEPYLQVVYVVRQSDRDLALKAIKKAREDKGLDTAPEAFVAIMRDYLGATA